MTRKRTRIKRILPQPFCMAKKRVKNGNHSSSATPYSIGTKLVTATQWSRPGVLAEPLFRFMSARRRYRSEKITFFAPGEKWTNLILMKKYSKNRRHPYAQFGVEIMLISLYLAEIWPKNHLKRRDLAKIRYNAL